MEIQRNQEFKVERPAKDEAIQEVLGLANTSGCMYSFHLLCFLSLLQLPCFRWKTSQLRPDLLLPEKGTESLDKVALNWSTCAKGSRDFALMSAGTGTQQIVAAFSCSCLKSRAKL